MKDLIDKCSNAKVCLPEIFELESFKDLIDLQDDEMIEVNGVAQTKGLLSYIQEQKIKPWYLKSGDLLIDEEDLTIEVMSPNKHAAEYFNNIYKNEITKAKQYFLDENQGLKSYKIHASNKFNLHSVVLKLTSNYFNILLCADQVYSQEDPNIGLKPIFERLHKNEVKFHVFKVPHHGSKTSYDFQDWSNSMVSENALLKLTPYRANSYLPTLNDVNNILSVSKNSWITNKNIYEKKYPNPIINKRIKDQKLSIRLFDDLYGEIRIRGNTPQDLDLKCPQPSCNLKSLITIS